LGNIGPDYDHTRHNAGFVAVDFFCKIKNSSFADGRYGFSSTLKIKNKQIILLKPSTFMNLSGRAVLHYLNKEKIPIERLLVIADDIALPFGKIRIRKKGGAGGHNGLQNIIDILGTSEFARIRIGIGNEFVKGYQSDYVLGEWHEEQAEVLPLLTKYVSEAIQVFAFEGIDAAMNKFNKTDIGSESK
jgi:peptidyl-tRNA hydrolase, PTH1 family